MKPRLYFFYLGRSTFVKKDLEALAEISQVHELDLLTTHPSKMLLRLIRQLFILLNGIGKKNLYICQFAGYHSFLPAFFARFVGGKCLIISGGTDCHRFTGIGYGNFQKRLLSWFTKWSFKWCNHIAVKHESLWQSEYHYDSKEPQEQGIAVFIPGICTPHSEITNGYEANEWVSTGCTERIKHSFITVTSGLQYSFQKQLKGIDLILAVAPLFPESTFTILGVPENQQWSNVPKNVRLLPPANQDVIKKEFFKHQFYLQLSMAEGFPNALCEAMLSGCIPIGSSVFSIPEIIGDNGYVVQHRDVKELKSILQLAIHENDSLKGEKASESIKTRYPLEKRKSALLSLCHTLID